MVSSSSKRFSILAFDHISKSKVENELYRLQYLACTHCCVAFPPDQFEKCCQRPRFHRPASCLIQMLEWQLAAVASGTLGGGQTAAFTTETPDKENRMAASLFTH